MSKIYFKLDFVILGALTLGLFTYYLLPFPGVDKNLIIIFVGMAATIPVAISAIKAITHKKITIDLLASIALIVSFIHKEWASAAFINLMITSARIFGDYTENKARQAIKGLLKLRPERVNIKKDGKIIEVHISQVKVGDVVVVEAGDRIPIDGEVIEGEASIDQSSLTGESIPVYKGKGSKVYSSTLNVSGSLVVKTLKVGKDTTFEKIIGLVEDAQVGKSKIQGIADKFASWYVLATLLGSVIIWSFSKNLSLVLSVLLVTCADDIAVAIPMAFWSGIAQAAKRGIIIKGGNFLEGLAHLKTVIVDKTGTLTRGKIKADEVVSFEKGKENVVLSLAAIAESVSEHPIAKAIVSLSNEKRIKIKSPSKFNEVPGEGVVVSDKGEKIIVGKLEFLKKNGIDIENSPLEEIHAHQNEGSTVVAVSMNSKIIGFIALSDEVRPNAKATIAKLRNLGVEKIIMLTGDNPRVAARVAQDLGISEYHADLLPSDKVNFIKGELKKNGKLAMIGDGVNDAASLAIADIGIAMGVIGSDAAIEASDVALMQDNFSKVAEVVSLSRYTANISRIDFVLWGATNILGLILAFSGVIGPQGAAAYNFVTDFLPIANSLRMFRYKSLKVS